MHSQFDKKDRLFAGALILVHLAAFFLAWHYSRIYMGDTFQYVYEAVNIKEHFFFYSGSPALQVTPEYMTLRPPGYPLFLLLVYMFSMNNWLVILLQNILSIFNILYVRRLMLRIGYHKKYDPVLLLLIVSYPAQFIFANTLAPDILLQTCTLVYIGNLLMLVQKKQNKYAWVMSIALVAGMMVKPILYPFALVNILLLTGYAIYHKRGVLKTGYAGLLPIIVILLYNSWNYERTGKFHFSSIQYINGLYYNCFLFYKQYYGADKAHEFAAREHRITGNMKTFKERYDYGTARSLQVVKDHFIPYSLFHAKESLRFFLDPGRGEIYLFTGKLTYGRLYTGQGGSLSGIWKTKGIKGILAYLSENPLFIIVLLVLLFNIIKAACLTCFFFDKKTAGYLRLFLLLFLCYFAVVTGPVANTRYVLPVSIIIAACSAICYQRLREQIKLRQKAKDPEL